MSSEDTAANRRARAQAAKVAFNVTPNKDNRRVTTKDNNQQEGGPNDQGTPATVFTPPPNLPPAQGRKPTILQGVNMDLINGKDFKTKVFVILKEAANGDEEAKKELRKFMMSTVKDGINAMLLAISKSAKSGLGHSGFEYLSREL